jgi:catechol 2,3-dioxygenase-like lactoylglutathione lyase family enzyme
MTRVTLDHVGITVADIDVAASFFERIGLEVEGRMFMEGEFVDAVIGIPGSRSEILTLRAPGGGAGVELSCFAQPDAVPGTPDPMSNDLGIRNVAFEVENLQAVVDDLAEAGYGLIGDIGEYEGIWKMTYVRGPEGIIVALAQRLD